MSITLDGTNGITTPAVSSTGASAFTGSLALPSGGLTVGTNQLAVDSSGRVTMPYQPMFCYYNGATGSQYPTAGSWVTLNAGLNNWSATRWYGLRSSTDFNATNGKFTAPVAGNYLFNANVSFWVTNTFYIDFWINGAQWAPYIIMYDTGNYQTGTITMIKQLGAGDTVELGGYFSASTTYVPGSGYLIFSGQLVG